MRIDLRLVSLPCLLAGVMAGSDSAPAGGSDPVVTGGKLHLREVEIDGVKHRVEVQFFRTRHGGQCWNGLGRDSRGNIFLGNSTHGKNSYVYRLDPRTGRMRYLGDLLGNVRFGGRGGSDNGKIHSGFWEWTDGCVYFPSHYGYVGNIRYGGHLWKYDPRRDRIVDVGVPMPGSTSFCISRIDPVRDVAYMMSTPTGVLIRYDFRTRTFTALQRTGMNWVRHLPMDAAGNVYIIGGNRIRKYDVEADRLDTVVEHTDADPDGNFGPMTAFCWTKDRRRLYFLTYVKGSVFAWDVGASKVEPLGKLHPEGTDLYIYNLHLASDGARLYSIGGSNKRAEKGFYTLDLRTGKRRKLFPIDDIIEHELEGKVRSEHAYVDFTDYGGVTGDDGTMYSGFHGGGRDQDLDPGGLSFVAIVAMRVRRVGLGGIQKAPTVVPTSQPRPAASEADRTATVYVPAEAAADVVEGVGLVKDYRMAVPEAGEDGRVPLAYWLRLTAAKDVPGSRDVVVYVHVGETDDGPDRYLSGRGTINRLPEAKTAHDPRFGRYLLRGRRLKYRGAPVPGAPNRPAFVDASVEGGALEIVFDAVPVSALEEFTVGKRVVFEGLVEPRKAWMKRFRRERWYQDWQLIVTLSTGETVDVGDRFLCEHWDFRRCLALIRQKRAVKVRVIGEVRDATPYKRTGETAGTPRDVRGNVLVAVEELRVLGDQPAGDVAP